MCRLESRGSLRYMDEASVELVYLGSWERSPWQERQVPQPPDLEDDAWPEWVDVVSADEKRWIQMSQPFRGYYQFSVALGEGTGQAAYAYGLPAAVELLGQWGGVLGQLEALAREGYSY